MPEKMRTTKEILRTQSAEKKPTLLYNPDALEKLRQSFEHWRNTIVREEDRKNWYATPRTILGSDIPREMLYTPLQNPDFDYIRDLGHSGQEPFTRGIHANMYRGKEFTMRQLTGFGGPEETNQRIKFMLAHGATGVNVLFDLPTIQMYDSDDSVQRYPHRPGHRFPGDSLSIQYGDFISHVPGDGRAQGNPLEYPAGQRPE
jgi:methylmalonyl-CoA mutase N-terminal domain/subunit